MKRTFYLLSIVPLLAGCGSRPLEEDPSMGAIPDTITVSPPGYHWDPLGRLKLRLATIADAITLDGGVTAILDEAKGCARLYTPEGEFIRQVSRSGSGPGELLRPGGIVRLSDNTIGILDHATGLQRFSASGEFMELRTDFLGQNVPQWAWGVNDMGYVGAITKMEPSEER